MKTEHTPEPWRVGRRGNDVVGSNGLGDTVAMMIDCDSDEQTHANARRIVTCVNACAGIPDELLYDQDPGCLLSAMVEQEQEIRAITKQRDELLAAAEAIEIDAEECLDFDECTAMLVPIDTYHKLMGAIASIKEKS